MLVGSLAACIEVLCYDRFKCSRVVFDEKGDDQAWPGDVLDIMQHVLSVIAIPQHYYVSFHAAVHCGIF
jgi:hypothetical protein